MACILNQCFQALMNHRQTPRRDRTNAASTFYTVLTDRTQDRTAGSSYNPNRHPTASQTVTATLTTAQFRRRTFSKKTSVQKARKRIPKYTRKHRRVGAAYYGLGSRGGNDPLRQWPRHYGQHDALAKTGIQPNRDSKRGDYVHFKMQHPPISLRQPMNNISKSTYKQFADQLRQASPDLTY